MMGTLARGRRSVTLLLMGLAAAPAGCPRSRPILSQGDAAVVILAAPVPVPSGLLVVPEREPVGPDEGPMVLPLSGPPGLAVSGALSTDGEAVDDEDVYAIDTPGTAPPDAGPGAADAGIVASPPGSQGLALEVTQAATLATVLELRDGTGTVVATSSGGPGVRHGLPNVGVRPGTRYLVTVRRDRARKAAAAPGTRPSGSYVLVIRQVPLGAGDEREPNDTPETATTFGPAHAAPEMAGYFGTPRDRDYYRVPMGELSESTVVSVFLTPPSSVTASLTVSDRSGAKVQSVRGRPGERVVLRALAAAALSPVSPGPAAEPAFFYVSVQTEGVAELEHRYVLGVRSEPSPDGEREPNDQPVRATVVEPGSLSGFLGPGDVDFFRCEVPAGAELLVELAPSRRTDLVLEVLMPAAPRPQRIDAARRGQPERLLVPASPGGAALIRVQGRRGTDQDLEEPYQLTLEVRPAGSQPPVSPGPAP